ncbi:MAG: hypothetical protein ACJAWW_002525 [Sulfurimonas sp.]|jgi:uncharacterized protein (TIGR00303 family)
MKTLNIFTNKPDSLPKGKADFLLAASVTRTCEIEGISQAGIPGKIPLTPTLDAELMATQKVFSLTEIPETPNGVPSPVLITKAVGNLVSYSNMCVLNLGLDVIPQNTPLQNFDINPSDSVATGANIDAKAIFEKGMIAGKNYELKGSYLILAESTPSGTTTAATTALALGYDCADDFSSSFLNAPTSVKDKTIAQALSLIDANMSNFEKLSLVSDNMLIFCAGFILEASRRFHVVLAGGTQMASCLLVADKLREDVLMRVKSENITLATTSWVANDEKSDIAHLLSLLSYTPHAVYTTFSFADAQIPVLKKYDNGEAKEGVGAGAALAYANTNGISNKELLEAIELIIYGM